MLTIVVFYFGYYGSQKILADKKSRVIVLIDEVETIRVIRLCLISIKYFW